MQGTRNTRLAASLPGRYRWLTRQEEVRKIETLLGMPLKTIGVPLWVSGDRKICQHCRREINWLDIVSSALGEVHKAEMIAQAREIAQTRSREIAREIQKNRITH